MRKKRLWCFYQWVPAFSTYEKGTVDTNFWCVFRTKMDHRISFVSKQISTARYKMRKADHLKNWKMKIFQTKAQFSQSKALIKLNPPQILPPHVLQQFDWCQTPHGQLQVRQLSQTKRWWTPGRFCWQSPQMDCWKLCSSESSRLLVRMLSLLNHPCRKLFYFSKSQNK